MDINNRVNTCPLQDMLNKVTKKWLLLVLYKIGSHGMTNYNKLLKDLYPISPKALADTLNALQKIGLITKKVISKKPFITEYSLKNSGKGLMIAIKPLLLWASVYTNHMDCPILSGFNKNDILNL